MPTRVVFLLADIARSRGGSSPPGRRSCPLLPIDLHWIFTGSECRNQGFYLAKLDLFYELGNFEIDLRSNLKTDLIFDFDRVPRPRGEISLGRRDAEVVEGPRIGAARLTALIPY
jgi:hypothetical protein